MMPEQIYHIILTLELIVQLTTTGYPIIDRVPWTSCDLRRHYQRSGQVGPGSVVKKIGYSSASDWFVGMRERTYQSRRKF